MKPLPLAWSFLTSKGSSPPGRPSWVRCLQCRRVRQAGREPYVYIILLTGRDRPQDVVEGLAAGADDYLRKPFDNRTLLDAPVTLAPGQTFYEAPDDVHIVGRNASQTEPAKFLVFLVKDKGAPLLTPVK